MKRLLALVEKIRDQSLKKKVLDALRRPTLSNKGFSYPPERLDRMPASLNWHHAYEGGWIDHTVAVTELSLAAAKVLEANYHTKIDHDALIAGAVLHDIGKLFNWKKGETWDATGCTMDHTMLGTAELYARGFPEKVVHIVGSHFGPEGPTPPQTFEAVILHAMDNFDAQFQASKTSQDDVLKLLFGQLAGDGKKK